MTTPADAAPAPEEPAGPRKRNPIAYFLQKRNPLVYVGQAAGVVALIASVVGLLFVFKPGWKPEPPPDVGTLKIVDSSVRQPVTFGRYLERVHLPPMGIDQGVPAAPRAADRVRLRGGRLPGQAAADPVGARRREDERPGRCRQ